MEPGNKSFGRVSSYLDTRHSCSIFPPIVLLQFNFM